MFSTKELLKKYLNNYRNILKLEVLIYLFINLFLTLIITSIILWISDIIISYTSEISLADQAYLFIGSAIFFIIFYGNIIYRYFFHKSSLVKIAENFESRMNLNGTLISSADFIENGYEHFKNLENIFITKTYQKLKFVSTKSLFTMYNKNRLIFSSSVVISIFILLSSILYGFSFYSPLDYLYKCFFSSSSLSNILNVSVDDIINYKVDFNEKQLFHSNFVMNIFSNAENVQIEFINSNKDEKVELTKIHIQNNDYKYTYTYHYIEEDLSFRLILKKGKLIKTSEIYSVKVIKQPYIQGIYGITIPSAKYSHTLPKIINSSLIEGYVSSLALIELTFNNLIQKASLKYTTLLYNDKTTENSSEKTNTKNNIYDLKTNKNISIQLIKTVLESIQNNSVSSLINNQDIRNLTNKLINIYKENKPDEVELYIVGNKCYAIFPILGEESFFISAIDENGYESERRTFTISMLNDMPPTVIITQPEKDETVDENSKYLVKIDASDDYSISSAKLIVNYKLNNVENDKKQFSFDVGKEKVKFINFEKEISFDNIDFTKGGIIEYYAEVFDNINQSAKSELRHFIIPIKESPLNKIKAMISSSTKALDKIKEKEKNIEQEKAKLKKDYKDTVVKDNDVEKKVSDISKKKEDIIKELKDVLSDLDKLKNELKLEKKMNEQEKDLLNEKLKSEQELLQDLTKQELDDLKKLRDLLDEIKKSSTLKGLLDKMPLKNEGISMKLDKLVQELKKRLEKLRALIELKDLFSELKKNQDILNNKIEKNNDYSNKDLNKLNELLKSVKEKLDNSSLKQIEKEIGMLKKELNKNIKNKMDNFSQRVKNKDKDNSLDEGKNLLSKYEEIENYLNNLINQSKGEEKREAKNFINNFVQELISISQIETIHYTKLSQYENPYNLQDKNITTLVEEKAFSKDFLKTRTNELNMVLEGIVDGKENVIKTLQQIELNLDSSIQSLIAKDLYFSQNTGRLTTQELNNLVLQLITLKNKIDSDSMSLPNMCPNGTGSSKQEGSSGNTKQLEKVAEELSELNKNIKKRIDQLKDKGISSLPKNEAEQYQNKLNEMLKKIKAYQNDLQQYVPPEDLMNTFAKIAQEIEKLKFMLNHDGYLKNPLEIITQQQEIPKKLLKAAEETKSWLTSKYIREKEKDRKAEAQLHQLISDPEKEKIKSDLKSKLKNPNTSKKYKLNKKQKDLVEDYYDSMKKYSVK